jgi:hypothetical protein
MEPWPAPTCLQLGLTRDGNDRSYRSGTACAGSGTSDSQTCAGMPLFARVATCTPGKFPCKKSHSRNSVCSFGGASYQCSAGQFRSGASCGGLGTSDTQTCAGTYTQAIAIVVSLKSVLCLQLVATRPATFVQPVLTGPARCAPGLPARTFRRARVSGVVADRRPNHARQTALVVPPTTAQPEVDAREARVPVERVQ